MKKTILLFLCVLTVGLSSCKKETFVPGTTNRTILFDIRPADWRLTPDGLGFFFDIPVPENDANFNQSGHIVTALSFDNANTFEGLPEVFGGVSYRFTSDPGFVTVSLRNINNSPAARPNQIITVKITLIDSQLIN